MKLVTFRRDRQSRLGALVEDKVVDLNQADEKLPADMRTFLSGGSAAIELAKSTIEDPSGSAVLELADVTIEAPIRNPDKIICIGLNYKDHAAESNLPLPDFPTVFAKYNNTIIGPDQHIIIPRVTDKIDYEIELAVIIGKQARHVSEADAMNFVAGYVPYNDVSARDYQTLTSQWTIGKVFDTFGPMGPALVTTEEITDPHKLDMELSIDGEVLQNSNTGNMIFKIPYLVAYLSEVMTLEPGDLISTGTPAGVGAARVPKRWLKAGQIVRIEIENLGVLENPVVADE